MSVPMYIYSQYVSTYVYIFPICQYLCIDIPNMSLPMYKKIFPICQYLCIDIPNMSVPKHIYSQYSTYA